jgi:voltage-gated potassium channel
MHEIIFEADTRAGRAFDVGLLLAIIASVVIVMVESVESIRAAHGPMLRGLEWSFTLLFTLEYGLRLLSVDKPIRYARSFFGIVDFLSIAPTYLSLLIAGTQSLLIIRSLRLLRIFRVLKLAPFLQEATQLRHALRASVRKIIVFLVTVITLVVILGALMYLVEGSENGFTSIPRSVYWAIVTMTTVGYGDIAPNTVPGQFLAAVIMILGYGIIAVPTGIVSVELAQSHKLHTISTAACPSCSAEGHDIDAVHCKFCGAPL